MFPAPFACSFFWQPINQQETVGTAQKQNFLKNKHFKTFLHKEAKKQPSLSPPLCFNKSNTFFLFLVLLGFNHGRDISRGIISRQKSGRVGSRSRSGRPPRLFEKSRSRSGRPPQLSKFPRQFEESRGQSRLSPTF